MAKKAKKGQATPADSQRISSTAVETAPASSTPLPATEPLTLRSLFFNNKTQRAIYLVALAAIWSPLSQLALSPVYGSLPSALYHRRGLTVSALIAFSLRGVLPEWSAKCLPVFAYWLPTIQFIVFKFSSSLGPRMGPLVTECLTCYPLVILSIYSATQLVEGLDLSSMDANVAELGPSVFFTLLFTFLERTMRSTLPEWVGFSLFTSRTGFQPLVATMYGLLLPSSLFWPALPSVAFSLMGNVHLPLTRTTDVLNNTLALYDYTLLERFESVTGYLSVLEDNKRQFRVMRCDHSLLGGEWLPSSSASPGKVGEPIYAVFTMLEAVRLVDRPKSGVDIKFSSADVTPHALNIGLGVGTAPSALITHGVNTTIVEIDPIVHYLAGTYFNLPKNHSYVLGDAVAVVDSWKDQSSQHGRYDYIIHDVFTGGAEPVQLFTTEFFTGLTKLMKPDGVIAINYAGDLTLPSASMIYRTITSVFANCRVFREDEQVSDTGIKAGGETNSEFTNMVFFCLHPLSGSVPLTFRKPIEADFLGSGARKAFMLPKHEVPRTKFVAQGDKLTRSNAKTFAKSQAQSAAKHWQVMRTVLPAAIWENW